MVAIRFVVAQLESVEDDEGECTSMVRLDGTAHASEPAAFTD